MKDYENASDYHFDMYAADDQCREYFHVPLRPELEDAGFVVLYWPDEGTSTVYDHAGAEFRSVRRSFWKLTDAADFFDGLEVSWWL